MIILLTDFAQQNKNSFDPFQALLRGALTQQSAVILVCMAVDRYMCMLHPHRYHNRQASKKVRFRV